MSFIAANAPAYLAEQVLMQDVSLVVSESSLKVLMHSLKHCFVIDMDIFINIYCMIASSLAY
jgi:hypothetical protein